MHSSPRVVLSAIAVFVGAVSTVHAQVTGLGAVGDSLTDEYFEESYSYAKNWSMQLVTYRGINMGPTAAAAGQAGGTWGEPRRSGYAYNWARYGADSAGMLSQGQHTGLAAQVTAHSVSHAVVLIGANDFSPDTAAYLSIYYGLWSQSQIDSYINAKLANVRTAVQTLTAAGAAVSVCDYVDFGVAPITRQLYPNASNRNRVSAVVGQLNAKIRELAWQNHAMFIDLNRLGTVIFGTNTALRQNLRIGNVDIQLLNKDTASHSNPLAGFVDDGAHPHTTLQGIFANVMMTALNIGWHTNYAPFTDQEILAHGAIAYGGADTLDLVIGPYTQYISNYVCPADVNSDGAVDFFDYLDFVNAFAARTTGADFNHDGIIDFFDYLDFVNDFTSGCP